jgi:polysaccharide export outer membrane protein
VRFFRFLIVALVLQLAAVAASSQTVFAQQASDAPQQSSAEAAPSDYRLGFGDKVHVGVFGQNDLDGSYLVDSSGNVQLPLIGTVHAAGRTVSEFQRDITAKLANGYLVNPSVSIAIEANRPFYIMGEVNKPGEYAYISGMSVLNAVVLAGGYTFRANESDVYVRHNGAAKEVEEPAGAAAKVSPGDIIRIPERFF